MEMKLDYSDVAFRNDGKLKLLIIVGTRPEIIRLAAVINKCRKYFDCLLAHTGQNYDYNLNGVFFHDLKLKDPEVYMDAVGDDLGSTMGNILNASYKLMVQTKPDAVLVLGDTNSCLSVISAKRLHIPIFHMEAGNRCFDECLPEETNRRLHRQHAPFTAFRRSGAEYHDEAVSLCPAADAGIDDGFFRAAAQKDGCKTGSECLKLSLPLTREAFLFSRPSSYFLRYPV